MIHSTLPTMYLAGVLVATLFTAAFADVGFNPLNTTPEKGSSDDGTSQSTALMPLGGQNDDDQPIQMSQFCFFGKFPSATCRFRCHLMNMDATCDESSAKCICQPEPKTTPEAPQGIFTKPETHKEQEAEKAKKPGDAQKTSQDSSSPSQTSGFTIPMDTAVQEPEEDQPKHHVVFYIFDLNKIFGPQTNDTKTESTQTEVPEAQVAPAGWAFQHFIAILIVLLLLVLIGLELLACYKKQRAKNNDMETIFKNIPMPNKA